MQIEGKTVQVDMSGVGHAWRPADDTPANIVQEIAGEIINGKVADCRDYVASNGLHYRWGDSVG